MTADGAPDCACAPPPLCLPADTREGLWVDPDKVIGMKDALIMGESDIAKMVDIARALLAWNREKERGERVRGVPHPKEQVIFNQKVADARKRHLDIPDAGEFGITLVGLIEKYIEVAGRCQISEVFPVTLDMLSPFSLSIERIDARAGGYKTGNWTVAANSANLASNPRFRDYVLLSMAMEDPSLIMRMNGAPLLNAPPRYRTRASTRPSSGTSCATCWHPTDGAIKHGNACAHCMHRYNQMPDQVLGRMFTNCRIADQNKRDGKVRVRKRGRENISAAVAPRNAKRLRGKNNPVHANPPNDISKEYLWERLERTALAHGNEGDQKVFCCELTGIPFKRVKQGNPGSVFGITCEREDSRLPHNKSNISFRLAFFNPTDKNAAREALMAGKTCIPRNGDGVEMRQPYSYFWTRDAVEYAAELTRRHPRYDETREEILSELVPGRN